MAVFNAGDVATEKTSPLFDAALRKVQVFS
jgi:hypothetical protein